MQQATQGCDLSQVVPLKQYRESRVHLFPSDGSMEWFLRRHKARLANGGGLLLMRGTWHVEPSVFDSIVLAIMQDESRALVGNGAGPVIA